MTNKKTVNKYVYFVGARKADGNGPMKNLLGGKGANLAEIVGHPKLWLPVPQGFTISIELCTYFYEHKPNYPPVLKNQVRVALSNIEKITQKKLGDSNNPLLLSVRSGARRSMPGMMNSVLDIGLNDPTIEGLIKQSGDAIFSYDAFRRLVRMYADVVKGKAIDKDPKNDEASAKF